MILNVKYQRLTSVIPGEHKSDVNESYRGQDNEVKVRISEDSFDIRMDVRSHSVPQRLLKQEHAREGQEDFDRIKNVVELDNVKSMHKLSQPHPTRLNLNSRSEDTRSCGGNVRRHGEPVNNTAMRKLAFGAAAESCY